MPGNQYLKEINSRENYLRVGRAKDLKDFKDKVLFRLFEILPGFLAWTALFLAVFLSWKKPIWIAVFIIIYVIFWFFRTIYFSLHLWKGYGKMKENEKINWMEKIRNLSGENYALSGLENWQDIYHIVVVPMYKESLEIVRGTFQALANNDYPKDKMIVVLTCEQEAGGENQRVAETIEKEFGQKFFRFLLTWHPANIPGELRGKGSNETWGAKKAKEIVDSLKIPYENVVFSTFDADTYIFPKYFSCLTYNYLTTKDPVRTSFQPVPFFINNIWQAPVVSRIFSFSATFWHTMCQERPEKIITFSSHSMSFKALIEVGFKQTNIVPDDSRIFWQCFLHYSGDYKVKPLYYPVSMDANVAKSFLRTIINMYKQQRRWAYGVADIPYFLFGFYKDSALYHKKKKTKKIPFRKKISLGFELIEGHFSWAVASILIFMLGWLPLILGGPEFSQTLISYNLSNVIGKILTVAMVGLVGSCYLSFLLLPPKPPDYGHFKYVIFAVGWMFFPFMMIFFTALPSLDAQTRLILGKYMGFWPTEKFRKKI